MLYLKTESCSAGEEVFHNFQCDVLGQLLEVEVPKAQEYTFNSVIHFFSFILILLQQFGSSSSKIFPCG